MGEISNQTERREEMKQSKKKGTIKWFLAKVTIKQLLLLMIAVMMLMCFIMGMLYAVVRVDIQKTDNLERRIDSMYPQASVERMAHEFERLPWYDHWEAIKLSAHVHRISYQYRLNPWRVWALGMGESGWYPKAISPKNAQGPMQVLERHFEAGEDPFCPYTNAERACYYLAMCKAQVNYKYGEKREFQYMVYLYNAGINSNPKRPHAESIGLWKRVKRVYMAKTGEVI